MLFTLGVIRISSFEGVLKMSVLAFLLTLVLLILTIGLINLLILAQNKGYRFVNVNHVNVVCEELLTQSCEQSSTTDYVNLSKLKTNQIRAILDNSLDLKDMVEELLKK